MTLKTYVLHQLREMRRELLTALEDLSEDDLGSFAPGDHWPIAWIGEHCTEVADKLLVLPVRGERLLTYAVQIADWPKRPPQPGDEYPALPEIESRWTAVCDEAVTFVEGSEEDDAGLSAVYDGKQYAERVLLAVNHTNSHLRSLRCSIGQKRLDHKWAVQQTHLA